MARLRELYKTKIAPELKEELKIENPMDIPRIKKIVVNISQGEALKNIKVLEHASKNLEDITGQKAIITRARTSIAGFKLRQGQPVGCCVTLRKNRMYEFLDRLIYLDQETFVVFQVKHLMEWEIIIWV